MFTLDVDNIERYEWELKTFRKRAYPFATKQTINRAAFHAQKRSREHIDKNMVQRNRFTKQSIRVNQAKGLNVRTQEASVGSTAAYMEDQEFGGIRRANGKQGVPIATSYSAGQGQGAQPRTRLPKRVNKLAAIQLKKGSKKPRTRKQANLVAIKQAAATGRKFVYLDLDRRKGIFRVVGGKRNPRIRMVHDLTRKSVRIPANPWLKPSVDKTQAVIPQFYVDSLRFQLRKQGLFRG